MQDLIIKSVIVEKIIMKTWMGTVQVLILIRVWMDTVRVVTPILVWMDIVRVVILNLD